MTQISSSSKQAVLIAAVLIGAGAFALAQNDPAPAAPALAVAQAQPAPVPVDAYEGQELPPGHPPVGMDGIDEQGMGELPPGHPPIDGDTGPAPGHGLSAPEAAVAPLADGVTVQKLYADASLAGKRVKIAARVVKSTANVLGRTWLHVQDGSGDAQKGDNDLVVTTASTPAIGDVVEIEGVVARDKDLGSGYRYDVLIEDASIRTRPAD